LKPLLSAKPQQIIDKPDYTAGHQASSWIFVSAVKRELKPRTPGTGLS
jgi:hypothetical protein